MSSIFIENEITFLKGWGWGRVKTGFVLYSKFCRFQCKKADNLTDLSTYKRHSQQKSSAFVVCCSHGTCALLSKYHLGKVDRKFCKFQCNLRPIACQIGNHSVIFIKLVIITAIIMIIIVITIGIITCDFSREMLYQSYHELPMPWDLDQIKKINVFRVTGLKILG